MEDNNNHKIKSLGWKVRKAVTHNIWLKLISLFLAFVIWFTIGGPKIEATVTVRLDLTNQIPDGWALAEDYIREIEVTISGRNSVIQRLANSEEARSEIIISPNRDSIQPTNETQRVPINPADVLVKNATVIRCIPREILLRLDERVTEIKPVSLGTFDSLPEGFDFLNNEFVVRPNQVEVTGAKSRVQTVSAVEASLNLSSFTVLRQGKISTSVLLDRDPLLVYGAREVEVILDIVEIKETRRINITDFEFAGLSENEEVRVYGPQRFTLEINGPKSWVDSLDATQLSMLIDLQNVPRDSRENVDVSTNNVKFSYDYDQMELVVLRILNDAKFIQLQISRN